mgnify:CR=1 FL=1
MNPTDQGKMRFLGFLLVFLFMLSCSTILHLNIRYRLPPAADGLQGRKVYLSFVDMRSQKSVMGPGARKAFKSVSENFTLAVARGSDTGFKIGVFEVPALFMEVFKKRLEQEGIVVVESRLDAEVELQIALENLVLDLQGRTWKAGVAYEGRLIKEGHVLAIKKVKGEAERLKLIGQKEADLVMGEIFTDAVNQLDVIGLFQEAGR